jgi:predicted hotdog family 3-hydroxylacyl-ACP dehydratase
MNIGFDLRKIDVHELLPQQEPFVMIGTLVDICDVTTATETIVDPHNLYVDQGVFSAYGLIENIAQTCAARIGFVNKYILKKGLQLGFIGAIRNLRIHGLPPIGTLITTRVTILEDVLGMTLATAVVYTEDIVWAEGEMKIAINEMNE